MARKTGGESSDGFHDIIGVALLAFTLLLVVAQMSFDRGDLGFLQSPPNKPAHNWIGPFGAYLAYFFFSLLGLAAYVLPFVLGLFGLAYLFNFFGYLRRGLWWSELWAAVLLLSTTGLLHILFLSSGLKNWTINTGAISAGGWLGYGTFEYGFWMLGTVGAVIVYGTLLVISLLFLTNFRLGEWLRGWVTGEYLPAPDATDEEVALEKKARDLEKKRRVLEQEVEKTATAAGVGLGQDLQPVPEPTVRDLSVPQAKARGRKPAPTAPAGAAAPAAEPPRQIQPADEGEIIPAREVAAATTAEILGGKSEAKAVDLKAAAAVAEAAVEESKGAAVELAADAAPEKPAAPDIKITGLNRPKPKRKPITVAATPLIGNYQLPTLDFLQHPDLTVKPTESKEELLANARLMQQTLAQFDIPVELGDITKGPTITRYELHPAPGVKLEKIQALSNNLAAALKAERIHILAPVPGKSSVGVEVPNPVKTKVIMRDLFEADEWRNTKARLPIALGKDVYGHPIIGDLTEMPHLLIAGSTGSGKSVCINSIIASLLYRFTPDQLRFVMIDPKVVELQQYNVLPHLVVPVVTDPKKVILALRWVVNEMEKRYQIFARVGVRNIGSFNGRPKNKPLPEREPELPLTAKKEKVEPGAEGFAVEVDEEIVVPREEDIVIPEKLSYIVVIIDELADLMLVAPADVEMAIARITQMARAAGIHCIVATQRPSVDVITGVIKANIPARIAFQVASRVDSRTILDAMGADKLLGKGDMLYLPPGSAKLHRAQGALVTDQEIQSVVDFIARQAKPSYEMEIHQQLSKPASSASESGIDEDESVIEDCIEVIRSEQKASVSLLQRRLRLGYGRAARIMDELENRGIVGPSKGAEPRDILIDLDGNGADGGGQSAV
jgi:S-DNA-T family DNA segregation ATPase FtsK/SpoIIIE